jgi:glycosyltransferase involved in cell wall biosynthesis
MFARCEIVKERTRERVRGYPLRGSEREERADAALRFSIILTFHNQRGFIDDAVRSALSQNASFEVIAVDDASTDGSQEVLKGYGDAIQFVNLDTNVGACAARNRGASLATGEYLVFLDGDDAFLPWALNVYDKIVQAKRPKMILANMRWFEGTLPAIGEAPQEITLVDYRDYLRRDRGFGHSASAMIIAREAFNEVNGWVLGSFPLDDVEIALRLGTAGRTIQILAPTTISHRAHTSNAVNEVSRFIPLMENMLRRERQGGYPGGRSRLFARRALIGGIAAHWIKRAAKAGLRSQAMRLAAQSLPMVSASVVRRFGALLGGRQPCEKTRM